MNACMQPRSRCGPRSSPAVSDMTMSKPPAAVNLSSPWLLRHRTKSTPPYRLPALIAPSSHQGRKLTMSTTATKGPTMPPNRPPLHWDAALPLTLRILGTSRNMQPVNSAFTQLLIPALISGGGKLEAQLAPGADRAGPVICIRGQASSMLQLCSLESMLRRHAFAVDGKALLRGFGYSNDGVSRFSRKPGAAKQRGDAWSNAWAHVDSGIRALRAEGYVLGMTICLATRTAGGGKELQIEFREELMRQTKGRPVLCWHDKCKMAVVWAC
jgi:hypothetical protein